MINKWKCNKNNIYRLELEDYHEVQFCHSKVYKRNESMLSILSNYTEDYLPAVIEAQAYFDLQNRFRTYGEVSLIEKNIKEIRFAAGLKIPHKRELEYILREFMKHRKLKKHI